MHALAGKRSESPGIHELNQTTGMTLKIVVDLEPSHSSLPSKEIAKGRSGPSVADVTRSIG